MCNDAFFNNGYLVLTKYCFSCLLRHIANLCESRPEATSSKIAVSQCSHLVAFFRKSSRTAHVLNIKQEALTKPTQNLLQAVDIQ